MASRLHTPKEDSQSLLTPSSGQLLTSEEKKNATTSKSPHSVPPASSAPHDSTTTASMDNDIQSASLHSDAVESDGDSTWMDAAAKRFGLSHTLATLASLPRSKKELQKLWASNKSIDSLNEVDCHVKFLQTTS